MENRLLSMQALRAVAAWLVVVGHVTHGTLSLTNDLPSLGIWHTIANSVAHSGVDIFFVISGAIMVIIAAQVKHSNRLAEALDFLLRRAIRIYPLFWITAAVTVLASRQVVPNLTWKLVRDLLLIDMPPEHPVAWTLIFEIRFYLMVAVLLILFKGRIFVGFALWAVALSALIFFTSYGILPMSWGTNPLMSEFIFGAAVGVLYCKKVEMVPAAFLAIGIAWFVATTVLVFPIGDIEVLRIAGFGAPAALVLYGTLTLERQGRLRPPKFLSRAGDASYSVYLWHLAIYYTMIQFWPKGGAFIALMFIAAAFVTIAIVSSLSFAFIERPLMRMARRIKWSSHPEQTKVSPGAVGKAGSSKLGTLFIRLVRGMV